MNDQERESLAAAGWVETSVDEVFGLNEVDMAIVDFRLAVSKAIRDRREAAKVSQATLASRIGVSQPRIPGIESASEGTSTDAILSAFFALGGTQADLAPVLAPEVTSPRAVPNQVARSIKGRVPEPQTARSTSKPGAAVASARASKVPTGKPPGGRGSATNP